MQRRLGGWWRIWIILTALWMGPMAILVSNSTAPDFDAHNSLLLQRLPSDLREHISLKVNAVFVPTDHTNKDKWDQEIGVTADNGYTLRFFPGVDMGDRVAVVDGYNQMIAAVSAQRKREHYIDRVMLFVVPPGLLLVVGLLIGWVVRGFRGG